MSPALVKMWISISSLGFMFISIVLIYLSRFKIKNKFIKFILSFFAYICLILAGLIIFITVVGGPSA